MYKNLEAEMARSDVNKKDLAELLGVRYGTILDKTNGRSRFFYDEALKIKNYFFPNHQLEYLFAKEEVERRIAQ